MKKQFAVTLDDEGKQLDDEDETINTLESELENDNRIGTFDEINWKDPFPAPKGRNSKCGHRKKDACKLQNAKVDEPVYSESRFNPMRPPNLTFIPSKQIMKKLMRVCTEIKDPIELYYIF